MFKPQHPYESTLRERFREFPTTVLNLMENLLAVDPQKRGTASSALISEVTLVEIVKSALTKSR